MRTLLLLAFLGCAAPQTVAVAPSPPPPAPAPAPVIVEQAPPEPTHERHPISPPRPPPPDHVLSTDPVDCQDQAVLSQYGVEKEAPHCLPGTDGPHPERVGCYWSLVKYQDGAMGPPMRVCRPEHPTPCYAHVVKRMRPDGVVVEEREPCQ